jgi:hypothetical protein
MSKILEVTYDKKAMYRCSVLSGGFWFFPPEQFRISTEKAGRTHYAHA